jgi:hypothetical protein
MTALLKRSISSVFAFDLMPSMAAMPVSVEQPVESEIQLCRTGAFYRADMGHFKVTQRTLEKMVTNAVERGVDIPINYYHKGGIYDAPIEERRSAGRLSPASLNIRSYKGGFGLFGIARWTAEAVSKIKAGEVQYISPEIEWAAVRLAASDAGPAGESIGPLLSGAALVDDPFFTLNPVTLSRVGAPRRGQRPGAPKRYSMLTDTKKANIEKLLKAAGIEAAALPGLMAQILVEIMSEEAMPEPEPVLEEVMPAAAATPATEGAAQQALAASRIREEALTKRVAALEATQRHHDEETAQALFLRYQREGRYGLFSTANDKGGIKKAKELFAKGLSFFRAVFDEIQPLTGARAPMEETAPPSLRKGNDNGLPTHQRAMDHLKAQKLTLTTSEGKAEYNRAIARFARE